MPFQNIFIDVGEETAIALPISDPFMQVLRNEAIAGFQKIDFIVEQNNTIIPDPKFFDVVGGKLHGASPITPVRAKLEQLFAPMNEKLFAVVNRNTAHHMSFFLADFAFRHFGNPGRKKVVINIDQHTDYGTGKSLNPSQFSTWGSNVVVADTSTGLIYNDSVYGITNYDNVTYISAANCSVATSTINDISILTAKKLGTIVTSGTKKQKINLEFNKFKDNKLEIYEMIENFLLREIFYEKLRIPTTSDTDYYITFDTDAMWGSNTCYKSGILDNKCVFSLIDKILKTILNNHDFLVGFDVTGLPINNLQRNPFDFPSYEDSFQQTNDIILALNKMLARYKF